MEEFEQRSDLWKRTLGTPKGKADPHQRQREMLRDAFLRMRKRAEMLATQIHTDLKHLTVHDVSHMDALWDIADLIAGKSYDLTPPEAFLLGASFLLHDLGMSLAAYPRGIADLMQTDEWKLCLPQVFRSRFGRTPRKRELNDPDEDTIRATAETVLRLRHAKQAEALATSGFQHPNGGETYFLIDDTDFRAYYGYLIGKLSYSHWWPMERLRKQFSIGQGIMPGHPPDWKVDPIKIACLLRTSDACHLDSRRAPGFLRAIRRPTGISDLHWTFQSYLRCPRVERNRLEFTSTRPFLQSDRDAWWLCFDAIALADKELRDANSLLMEMQKPAFQTTAVAGASDPEQLSSYIEVDGWIPVKAEIRVSDVASLVNRLGGTELYGDVPSVPLRELVQNARDAVVARRVLEDRPKDWGRITVRIIRLETQDTIEIEDTGIGMSTELLTGLFLDFGRSYWGSDLMLSEHPELAVRLFEPIGKFGIGFYSVFMWGKSVQVITRGASASKDASVVLEFPNGLDGRPILRKATETERSIDPGTKVRVTLDRKVDASKGLLRSSPLGSELAHRQTTRKTWSIGDLCVFLCPALDVDLYIEDSEDPAKVVGANDWLAIESRELIRRCIMYDSAHNEILDSNPVRAIIKNVRPIIDPEIGPLGRGAIVPWINIDFTSPTSVAPERYAPPIGIFTSGLFFSSAALMFAGIFLGDSNIAARDRSPVLRNQSPTAVAQWASEQARLLMSRSMLYTYDEMAAGAGLVRTLGGDTGPIPIARMSTSLLSADDIARANNLPDEIVLVDDHWVFVANGPDYNPETVLLNDGILGVSNGIWRRLFYLTPPADPQCRSQHSFWKGFWMSCWGAAVESIAKSWGVPLDEVLEASDLSESHDAPGIAIGTARGEQVYAKEYHIIRKPVKQDGGL